MFSVFMNAILMLELNTCQRKSIDDRIFKKCFEAMGERCELILKK